MSTKEATRLKKLKALDLSKASSSFWVVKRKPAQPPYSYSVRRSHSEHPGMLRRRDAIDNLQVLDGKNDEQRRIPADEDQERCPEAQPQRRIRGSHVKRLP